MGDEILLQSIVTVRPADGGLDSSTDGLPRTSALGPIDINAIDITLLGMAGSPAKGFVSNPTSCAPATTTVDATAYDGAQGSGAASFTPTGCDKLAFAPTLSAAIEPGAKGAQPTLTTVVESPARPGQRAHRADHPARGARRPGDDAQPRLPGGRLRPGRVRGQRADRQREGRDAGAGRAAGGAGGPGQAGRVAAARARHRPARADRAAPAGEPGLRRGGRLQSTLDGLPDTALSRFTLTLAGGPDGLLSNARDLCSGATARVDAAFAGQNGATSTASVIPQIAGCKPQVKATLKGLRRHHPVLALRFTAPLGQRLTSVGVSLPRTLRVDRKRARKATTVLAGGRKVSKPTLHLAGAAVTAAVPKAGARTVELHLNRGALRVARRLRAGQTVKLTLATADAAGGQQKLPLSVRAGR